MTQCTCMVQEGQISDAQQAELRTQTSAFAKRHFGSPGEINWVTVPKGSGYTAGKPSTSVIVSVRSNRPLPPSERVPLLHELEQIWTTHAGRTSNEVVSVIPDPLD